MDPNEEWEQWRTWLGNEPMGDTIYAQVAEMLAFRQVWDVFFHIFKKAPGPVQEDATFLMWFRVGYARSQASGVRRMVDMDPRVVSLARLIDRVRRYPTVLSRERYVSLQGEDDIAWADRSFDGLAGADGDYIDPRTPAQDFEDLRTKTASVVTWVNTSIAHLEKGRPEGPPLQAVHDAVDVVADLFVKYSRLIHGATVESGVIMEPWPYVFRFPWIADDDASFRDVMAKMDESERRRSERQRPPG